MKNLISRLRVVVTTAVLVALLIGCTPTQTPPIQEPPTAQKPQSTPKLTTPTRSSTSVHLLLGNPSSATEDVANPDNYSPKARETVTLCQVTESIYLTGF